jgi:hypothetical protein
MRIWAIAALVAAGPAAAQTDLTATYRATGGMEMVMRVEVAANGDLRGDMSGPGLYMIKKAGRTYFVMPGPQGPLVEDFEDLAAVMQEEIAKTQPHLCDEISKIDNPMQLKPAGTVTIAGYRGEAYSMSTRPDSRPDLVISRDPALAPLRAAMAAQFRLSGTAMGACSPNVRMFRQMQDLLESGAPLALGPMRLEKVETGPIDPARFVLPAPPATREQIRESMTQKKGPVVTLQPRPNR